MFIMPQNKRNISSNIYSREDAYPAIGRIWLWLGKIIQQIECVINTFL